MLKTPQNAISTLCYFTKRRTSSRKIGIDTLYTKEIIRFYPKNHRSQKMVQVVLSSAIVSNLALETI
jgi:hypothetical protein